MPGHESAFQTMDNKAMGRAGGGDGLNNALLLPFATHRFSCQIVSECLCNSMGLPWVDSVTSVLHRVEDFKGKRVAKGAMKQLLWKASVVSRSGELYQH